MKELRNALLLFKNAQISSIELKLSRRENASSSRTYTCSLKTSANLIKAFFLKPQNPTIKKVIKDSGLEPVFQEFKKMHKNASTFSKHLCRTERFWNT